MADKSVQESDNSDALPSNSEILTEIFNVTSVGLAVFDARTRVVVANPAFALMVAGASVSDCVGRTIREILGGAPANLERAIKTTCDTGVAQPAIDVAAKLPHSGLVNHWLLNLVPIRGQRGRERHAAAIAIETNHHKTIQEYFLTLVADIGWIREQMSKDKSATTNHREVLRQSEEPSLLREHSEEVPGVAATLKTEVVFLPSASQVTHKRSDSAGQRVPTRPKEEELESLSPRELQILTLAGSGKSNKEIALLVHISIKTVETHRNRINRKLDLHSIRDVVLCAVRNHLVSVEHSQETSDELSGLDLTSST